MIVRFIVSNYKSFKDETEINFISGNYKRHKTHVNENKNFNLLRCAVIYGNNATGKTNLLQAIQALHDLVVFGVEPGDIIELPYFRLDKSYEQKPTKFEIEFVINDNWYSYSISMLKNVIEEEWLYKMIGENKYEIIFERKRDNNGVKLILGNEKKLSTKEKLRREIYAEELIENEIFFYKGYKRKLPGFEEPYTWFLDLLMIMGLNEKYKGLAYFLGTDKKFTEIANQIICNSNLGIVKIGVIKTPIDEFFGKGDQSKKYDIIQRLENYDGMDFYADDEEYSAYKTENGEIEIARIVTYRLDNNDDLVEFNFIEESEGVKRLFNILPAIINSLISSQVYIIDEIESSFHPSLIKDLLRIYLQVGNEFKSQLLFSTHECNLLDLKLFRQDEIWFTQKNDLGATVLNSLSDYKPRFDKDIKKGYLDGEFSDIPFLGDFTDLNWVNENAKEK